MDPRPVHWFSSFGLLEATDSVGPLRETLPAGPDVFVVRRQIGLDTYFYAFWRDELIARLNRWPAETALAIGLDLHEWKASLRAPSEGAALAAMDPGDWDWRAVVVSQGNMPERVGFVRVLFELNSRGSGSGSVTGRTSMQEQSSEEGAAEPAAAQAGEVLQSGGAKSAPPDETGQEAVSNAGSKAKAPAEPESSSAIDDNDPPRSAYGLLTGPDKTVVGEEFTLEVGLARDPQPGVAGGALVRPESSRGPYTLDVQVTADGFDLKAGESWRGDLQVSKADPYPSFTLHLRAQPQAASISNRMIQVKYALGGAPIGYAIRSITVAREADHLVGAIAKPQDSSARMEVPHEAPVADLTVTIAVADAVTGRLAWTFDVGPGIAAQKPTAAAFKDIGIDTLAFAQKLMNGMNAQEGVPGIYQYLIGTGREIAGKIPSEFWPLFRAVSAQVQPRQPTLLILTEEPHVPWELATVEPLAGSSAQASFLAVEAVVGRWILDLKHGGDPKPKPVPPSPPTVSTISVIVGDYGKHTGWRALPEANQEAQNLETQWHATAVEAEMLPLLSSLGQAPGADVLHFACHGVFDPNSIDNGLFLADGHALSPEHVMGVTLSRNPFVFLNACQVGQGSRTLGDYGGMAQAFLFAGACGVIAPLWSIKDEIAREIAERFYTRVFHGDAPAAVLRDERLRLQATVAAESGTWMAYVYFGHPSMQLRLA